MLLAGENNIARVGMPNYTMLTERKKTTSSTMAKIELELSHAGSVKFPRSAEKISPRDTRCRVAISGNRLFEARARRFLYSVAHR